MQSRIEIFFEIYNNFKYIEYKSYTLKLLLKPALYTIYII
jgi:hypothetical protein